MAYRGEGTGNVLEAKTAEGVLRLALAPASVVLTLGARTLQLGDKFATLIEEKRKHSAQSQIARDGKLYIARGVPREDLGVWLEVPAEKAKHQAAPKGIRRIFGATPPDLFADDGLHALNRLDAVAARLRVAVAELGGWSGRATEIGAGHALDKVLLAERGDHHAIYARGLFRDRARLAMEVHDGGRVIVFDKKNVATEIEVRSHFQITIWGDYIRFADRHGTDRVRAEFPWLAPEDRRELARRIGLLVERA